MKTIIWASMQNFDVLERLDLLLPNLVDEEQVRRFHAKRISRSQHSRQRGRARGGRAGLGFALVTLGVAMLIPGPVDLILLGVGTVVGSYIGAPWLGAALVAAYNIVAIAMIVVGTVLIISSLL